VFVGTFGRLGGPVAVSVLTGARRISSGIHSGGYPDNAQINVPIKRVRHNLYDATVCVANLGTSRLQFAGNLTPRAGPKLSGQEVIRFDWLLPDRPSWWTVANRVASRFALVKPSFVGAWTFWAVFAVLATLWAAAIAVLLRFVGR
jgi:hypothetical protein